jgi:TolB-like protein
MTAADHKAVFLSYASQDAEAARMIADALRGAGVEVWYDQNELRGGDAWDKKIRTQIRDCALFVPVISANTQSRLEGYFRLEWKLAEDRSHLMAKGKPFLVPVVIDATTERDAHVPDAFVAVQWTRLRPAMRDYGGQARDDASLAALCEQVQRLLGGTSMEPGRPRPGERGEGAASPVTPRTARGISSATFRVTAALVVLAVAGYLFFNRSTPNAQLSASSPAAADKSLVVLPLENLSPDPDNAFFTDGMHAEIISTLQGNADLKLASRNAALAYKGSNQPIAAIARDLGVANVITGSVRRERDRVRIQIELRRAHDDALLWALPKLDRSVIDALAVQTEVAEEVSRVLQARAGGDRGRFAQFMTRNPRAYDLYLKALNDYLTDGYRSAARLKEYIALMSEAVRLDPGFMPAARLLSRMHSRAFALSHEPQDLLHHASEGKKWGETASRLAPGGAGDAALAQYYAMTMRDGERALPLAQNAIRALPNDPDGYAFGGYALILLGRRSEAAAHLRRATELDAGVSLFWSSLLDQLSLLRRADQVEEEILRGQRNVSEGARARARYHLSGILPPIDENASASSITRVHWHWRRREFAAVVATVDLVQTVPDDDRLTLLGRKSDALLRLGRTSEAEAVAREMLILAERLQETPDFGSSKAGYLARAWVRTGRAEDALAAMRRYIEAVHAANVGSRWAREILLADMLAHLRRARECTELLAKLLRVPSGITVPMLKVDPAWDNVRDDPAFKALLTDPKNSAPL